DADGVLHLTRGILRLAFRFGLRVTGHLAGNFLGLAFGLFPRAFNAIFIHCSVSILGFTRINALGGEPFRRTGNALVLPERAADDGANNKQEMSMRLLAALVALMLSAATALAQGYPNKPVRVVVGFAAGG